jgi:hypothetical protein
MTGLPEVGCSADSGPRPGYAARAFGPHRADLLPSLEGRVTGHARLADDGISFLSRWCCGATVRGVSALTAV